MAGNYLDFEAIKAKNDIVDVANRLGLELTQKGAQYRGPCPTGEGGDRALCITPAKQRFYSFAAQRGGDVLELVAFVNNVTVKEAAEWLSGGTAPEEKPEKGQNEGAPRGGMRTLDHLDPSHEAVEALGIPDAEEIGIGFAKRGVGRGSVMIPIRLPCGTLVGYLGVQELTFVPKEWRYP